MRALRRRGFEQTSDAKWQRDRDGMKVVLEKRDGFWSASATFRDPRAGIVEAGAAHESPSEAAVTAVEQAELYADGGGDPNRLI